MFKSIYHVLPLILFSCLVSCTSFSSIKPSLPDSNLNSEEALDIFPGSIESDFVPCSEVFDADAEFDKALECTNSSGALAEKLVVTKRPSCRVAKATSKGVSRADSFNYLDMIVPQLVITQDGQVGIRIIRMAVLGLFVPETENMYIVENTDQEIIYRHELQHYFLKLGGSKEQGNEHSSDVWKKCEAPRYSPTTRAKIAGWFHRFGQLF